MSRINVNTISGIGGTHIQLLHGAVGDASRLTFPPNIISFNPEVLSSNSEITTNITFTFNTNIEFSSVPGDIKLRSGSSSGSVIETFTTGSSSRLTIAANTLTIDPTSDLIHDTTYYVELPSVGIANTFGAHYSGSNTYHFRTKVNDFELTGGNYSFNRMDPTSPTGLYRYHIFTGSGSFTINKPMNSAVDLTYMLIAGGGGAGGGHSPSYAAGGGGGAGGVLNGTGPTISMPGPNPYTVTIGGGGSGGPYSGYNPEPTGKGTPSVLSGPTGTVITAQGGGVGGTGYPSDSSWGPGKPGGSGGGGGLGSPTYPTQPSYPNRGNLAWPGGNGVPGQGNSGGRSSFAYTPTYGHWYNGAGGGGAGGQGGNGTYSPWPGPGYWPSYPNNPNWNTKGGDGGQGRSIPAFSGPNLLGYLPDSVYPMSLLVNANSNGIGPNGYWGGGGAGGAPHSVPFARGGAGGVGGGGHAAWFNTTSQHPTPASMQPEWPRPSPNPYHGNPGWTNTGGGGGSRGCPDPSNYTRGSGGSGVFMVRYAVVEN